ncbi:MAG: hypothetical protein KTR25_09395 [Myxococcales bacterium]|nr:hypothetical protein [Myxococcales bacterium]
MPEHSPSLIREELVALVQENRQAAAALHTIFELCVEMGVLSLTEFTTRSQLAEDCDAECESPKSI